MNILVINGSPKGKNSITLQTVLYLDKLHPEHQFSYLHAGQQIRSLEKDFSAARQMLCDADLILFSYPVYTFIVPSQLHRFIELTKISGVDLRGKFVSQISTSKHFYDVTAHAFIRDNVQDLGMKNMTGLSADMEDLLSAKGRTEARSYFEHLLFCMENDLYDPLPPVASPAAHLPVAPGAPVKESSDRQVVIVADLAAGQTQLAAMIERFRNVIGCRTTLVNLRDFPFQGGCLGCFQCAADGKCVYKDGFDSFLRTNIQQADGIVIAFPIQDHSMGSLFKMYDDRQFCNGHRTVTQGTPFGYLISGSLEKETNLQMIIEGRAQVGGNYLAGIATDENDPNQTIDQLALNLNYAMEHQLTQPANFLGVGGTKIFRDLIWQMQGMMKADHRFYKEHGIYDFPQKKRGKMLLMYLVGALNSNPKLRAKMGGKMTEGMLMPYTKVLQQFDENKLDQ